MEIQICFRNEKLNKKIHRDCSIKDLLDEIDEFILKIEPSIDIEGLIHQWSELNAIYKVNNTLKVNVIILTKKKYKIGYGGYILLENVDPLMLEFPYINNILCNHIEKFIKPSKFSKININIVHYLLGYLNYSDLKVTEVVNKTFMKILTKNQFQNKFFAEVQVLSSNSVNYIMKEEFDDYGNEDDDFSYDWKKGT